MTVLVIGGRGFLGRAVCNALKGTVYTYDRRAGGRNHRRGSIADLKALERATKDVDVVVNLAGLSPLRQPRGTTYDAVHVDGVRNLITACRANKVRKVVHVSALGADARAEEAYLRTKGQAEHLLLKHGLDVTIIRPSVLWGPGGEFDQTLNKLAKLRVAPGTVAKLQPLHVDDLSKLIALATKGRISQRKLDVAGPEQLTLAAMVERRAGRKILILPPGLVRFGVRFLAALRVFGLSKDQVSYLGRDNTTTQTQRYLKMRRFS